jgi:hypothetical protein
MSNSLSENTIDLDKAQQRIIRWREYIGDHCDTHAFFISKDDIKALHAEIDANHGHGVRAYLARNEENQNCLLLVAVHPEPEIINGTDIIAIHGVSQIYDLTSPCPNMCDYQSPLLEIPGYKKKTKLSDLSGK